MKENIKLSVWNDAEDHTEGQNGYEWQRTPKEGPRSNNTGLGKLDHNKQP